MIVTEAELRTMLGLSTSISDEERAVLSLIHPESEGLVKAFLGYDPEQRTTTEYYPRGVDGASAGSYRWDVDSSHTRAVPVLESGYRESLQLERVPVRSITSVHVDPTGRFGKAAGAFPAGSAWQEGEDFWAEYEQDNLCMSGVLIASGAWPASPGSVKVTYRAGYAPDELLGRAVSSTTDDGAGNIVTAGVDASPIRRAVVLTAVRGMNQWAQMKKSGTLGWTGPKKSERLQDYSYTADSSAAVSSLAMSLAPEVEQMLEPFQNYGILRL